MAEALRLKGTVKGTDGPAVPVTAGRCIIFVRQHSRIGAGKYLQHDYATVERQRCDDCC